MGGAFEALVMIIILIVGILVILSFLIWQYKGRWTWMRAWLCSSAEEKIVLTKSSLGQYHPNGYMIYSESDFNISGRGSFRRFHNPDFDFDLRAEGSPLLPTLSISEEGSKVIPPQPLRPAPVLPNPVVNINASALTFTAALTCTTATAAVVTGISPLLYQSKVEDQETRRTRGETKIPVGIETANKTAVIEGWKGSECLDTEGNNLVNEIDVSVSRIPGHKDTVVAGAMTNPFLPFLQASSQFLSQTLQGFQSLQNPETDSISSGQQDASRDDGISTTDPAIPTGYRSGRTMGELLFPSPPQSAGISENLPGGGGGESSLFSPSSKMGMGVEERMRFDLSNPFTRDVEYNKSPPLEGSESQDEEKPKPEVSAWSSGFSSSPISEKVVLEDEKEERYRERDGGNGDGSYCGNRLIEPLHDPAESDESQIVKGAEAEEPSTTAEMSSISDSALKDTATGNGSATFNDSATTKPLVLSPLAELKNESCRQTLRNINSYISASFSGTQQPVPNFALLRNVRSFSLRQASTDSVGSDGSDTGSPDGSSSLPSLQRAMSCDSVSSDTSVSLEQEPPQLTGHLCISLEYDSEAADLLVTVVEAKQINGLHPDPCTPFDSYVRVYLLPDKSTNMQTRVYRKSLNPVYKEKFMFGIEVNELAIRSLVFYMYATDKYSNTLIGETELKLRDVNVHQLPVTLWLPLTDTGQRGGDFGEIMFSLSYLPTAERLTVVVVKARNLKFPRENTIGDPFVKVYLLQRGKKVSKKKSSTKRGEKNPIFNEAMIFSVPAHALQTIQLRITVADSGELEEPCQLDTFSLDRCRLGNLCHIGIKCCHLFVNPSLCGIHYENEYELLHVALRPALPPTIPDYFHRRKGTTKKAQILSSLSSAFSTSEQKTWDQERNSNL